MCRAWSGAGRLINAEMFGLFRLNQQSLTDVQIACDGHHRLPAILKECPIVTHLHWRMCGKPQPFELPWRFTRPLKLKHLSIHGRRDPRCLSLDVLQLLSNSLELETFYLLLHRRVIDELYHGGTLLETLDQRCSKLRRLNFARGPWQDPNALEKAPCSINNVHYASHITACSLPNHSASG